MHEKMRRLIDEKKIGFLVDDGKFRRVKAQVDWNSYSKS